MAKGTFFRALPDVQQRLDKLDTGEKARVINKALKEYFERRDREEAILKKHITDKEKQA